MCVCVCSLVPVAFSPPKTDDLHLGAQGRGRGGGGCRPGRPRGVGRSRNRRGEYGGVRVEQGGGSSQILLPCVGSVALCSLVLAVLDVLAVLPVLAVVGCVGCVGLCFCRGDREREISGACRHCCVALYSTVLTIYCTIRHYTSQ